jgi:hypothetical protein
MVFSKSNVNELLRFLKYLYIVLILSLCLYVIIEVKAYYQIDIIKGVDTPIDNVYFGFKEDINGLV